MAKDEPVRDERRPRPQPVVQPIADAADIGLRMTSAQGGVAWLPRYAGYRLESREPRPARLSFNGRVEEDWEW